MTAPANTRHAGPRPARSTLAGELRAVADFIEANGMHDSVHVTCRAGHVSISVWEPYEDAAARQAVVTRLAGLIGGAVQRENRPAYPEAGLRAEGTIGGLHAEVHTRLTVRRTGPRPGAGRPLAQAPDGQITAVRGCLPGGWRWVTELDPAPGAAGAPALAARDCPPLTSEALRAAAQTKAAAGRPAHNGTQAAVSRLSRGGS